MHKDLPVRFYDDTFSRLLKFAKLTEDSARQSSPLYSLRHTYATQAKRIQRISMNKITVLLLMFILVGCSTPEYRSAKNECSYDAFQKYPINNVSSIITLTRAVQVPTGQTNCTTQYIGNYADTQCTQIMRTEYVPYQQSVVTDTNANSRQSAINSCAAQLCYSRYGNADCKSN